MIWDAFEQRYLGVNTPYLLGKCRLSQNDGDSVEINAVVCTNSNNREITGKGNGPIDAFSNALREHLSINFRLLSYYEHAIEKGSDSRAAAYIQIEADAGSFWGAGIDPNIDRASFKAILSALNRSGVT